MMKKMFCDNPKCRNHIEIDSELWEKGTMEVYHCNKRIRICRHDFVDCNGKQFSFCDCCRGAIEMAAKMDVDKIGRLHGK